MDMLDFSNYLSDPAFDEFERDHIQAVYTYIEKGKVLDLTLFLTDFREGLLFYYTESRKIIGDYYYAESASIFFSQFLQHLFCYILQKIEDSDYVEVLLKMILNRHTSDFYYQTYDDTGEITLWIDPNSQGTVLIEAFRKANQEVVEILLETLKKAFRMYNTNNPISPEFEYYLFHENNLGLSALNIVWIKEKKDLETCLFNLAEKLYGSPDTKDFQRFLFQIDAKGNSALMRAIERKNENIIVLIFERVRELSDFYNKKIIQYLIQHRNHEGSTILHKAIQTSPSLLGFLLRQSAAIFGTIRSDKFSDFLLIEDRAGETAFLLACQQNNRKIIDLLFRYALKNNRVSLGTVNKLMLHKNNQGYSALILVVEVGHLKNVQYLLNSLLGINCDIDGRYNKEGIFSVLSLQSPEGYSLLQLAAKQRHWQTLDVLLDSLAFLSIANKKTLLETINYAKESEHNLLTLLYREEVDIMQLAHAESRLLTPEEKAASSMRLALANKLVLSRFQTSVRTTLPAWQFIESRNWLQRTVDFFGIFCSPTRRQRRAIDSSCDFLDKLNPTIPETPVELYKEALIHLVTVFTAQNIDSITQISLIRNSDKISSREQSELNRFSRMVHDYYTRYGSAILGQLKQITVPNLELAFAADTTHILVDSGNNLLILTKDKLFCSSLLSAASVIPLSSQITHNDLKNWLDTYFSSSYTLHPVNLKSALQGYPTILTELVKPIISDSELLNRNYEGLPGKTLHDLFLLNKQPIELEKLTEDNFLSKYGNNLNYRTEKFHTLFFQLSIAEKASLKKLLIDYAIRPMQYDFYSDEENEFLTSYGLKVNNLLEKNNDLDLIQDTDILNLAIDTHEELLLKEYHLSSTEKKQIIAAFRSLKNSLPFNLAKESYMKAVFQLIILLFPNAVQSLVNKDPWPLVTPIGLIAADSSLRVILTKLINHPQAMQLFTQPLSHKIGNIISQSGRVPLIGTTLALYGLVNSGKTLAATDKNDPNRPYYAHLFINNLETVGLMGAEAATSLPFWPVLGLFTVLTSDQIITEGRRLHDNVFHLQDDKTHPLLKFYSEVKLGLDIVDDDIKVIEGQRQLFDGFIPFLNSMQNQQNADIVAITLPAIRQINLSVDPHKKNIACTDDASLIKHPPIYPQTMLCNHPALVIDKKDNYSFGLGKQKTFCEKRDPFYTTIASNFSLWVGSLSPTCTLGQEITTEAIAETTGEGAAALLINTQTKETKKAGNYTLLLPIDPNYVGIFTVNFMRDTHAPNNAIKKILACDRLISHCIKKIRVLVMPFSKIVANDRSMETQLIINDQEFKNATHNQSIQIIEYIITKNANFTIHNNQIPEQFFTFIHDSYHLYIEENSILRSSAGFQVSLTAVRKLIIVLNDNAWIAGRIEPRNEQLVIHHLQGENQTNNAILDIRRCKLCALSLGKNLQIISHQLIMHIQGNFETPVLGINSHHGNTPFYRLLTPINHWIVTHKKEDVLHLSLLIDQKHENKLGNILLFNRKPKEKKAAVIFSGNYLVNRQICFARLLIYKYTNDWECGLEINASQFNDTSDFDLSALQKQNFNKISILTQSMDVVKTTHYLFYQLQPLPVVSGKFSNYQLQTSADGWVIILKHVDSDEETHCFVSENTTEIIVENIRYEIKPAIAALFALNTVDNRPLDVSHLIAPLKIDKPFSETEISLLAQNEYRIDNLSLINFSKRNIYFTDENLPFSYLKYALLLNKTAALAEYNSTHSNDSLIADKPVASAWVESKPDEGWMQRLNGVLLSGAALITTTLSVSCFMLIKRFKRPSLQGVSSNILPLLEIKSTSAHSISLDKNLKKMTHQKSCSTDKILLNTSTKDYISDLACDYLEAYDRHISKKSRASQKITEIKRQVSHDIQNGKLASIKQEQNRYKPVKGRELKEKKCERILTKKVFFGQKNYPEEMRSTNLPIKQTIIQTIKKQNPTTFFKGQYATKKQLAFLVPITHANPMRIEENRNYSKPLISQKTTQHPRLTHQTRGSRSHNTRDSLWTTPMNLNDTLFALNFCVRAVTGNKQSSRALPKKVQKGLDYVEKVKLKSSGFKVGGKINNTFYVR
jgi:hypothetical protein